MKYYTETIPDSLAEKLKEKGMPMGYRLLTTTEYERKEVELICPIYAECLDWLLKNRLSVNILGYNNEWQGAIRRSSGCFYASIENTWHEAANAAIEKALTLI